jgi:hypothetical protein
MIGQQWLWGKQSPQTAKRWPRIRLFFSKLQKYEITNIQHWWQRIIVLWGSLQPAVRRLKTDTNTWTNLKCSDNSIYLIIEHFHDVLVYPALLYIFLIYWNTRPMEYTMLKYVLQCFARTIIGRYIHSVWGDIFFSFFLGYPDNF